MPANQRLVFRHKIPQKNLIILGLSLVVMLGAMWFTGGDSTLQLFVTVVPIMAGSLALAIGLGAYVNRRSVSELAFDGDDVLARLWGWTGNGRIIQFPRTEATDWTLVEKMGTYLYIGFTQGGTQYRLPLFNAQYLDWNGLAELAPHVVAELRRKHGSKTPRAPGA